MLDMVDATTKRRELMMRALDEMPKSVSDAVNYASVGFTARDIVFLHSLYVNGAKTEDELVTMIKQKDAFETLLSPFGRRMTV